MQRHDIRPVYWWILLGTLGSCLSQCHAFVGSPGLRLLPRVGSAGGWGRDVSLCMPQGFPLAGHTSLLLVLFLGSCVTSFIPRTCTYIPSVINCLNQSHLLGPTVMGIQEIQVCILILVSLLHPAPSFTFLHLCVIASYMCSTKRRCYPIFISFQHSGRCLSPLPPGLAGSRGLYFLLVVWGKIIYITSCAIHQIQLFI